MALSPPVFGKRDATFAPPQGGAETPAQADGDHATFFAATRAELAGLDEVDRPCIVPRSFVAAILAGIIVGCCLAGLDIAGVRDAAATGRTVIDLSALLGQAPAARGLSPSMILLGVIGGGRAAATSLLIGHEAVARLGLTSHAAYVAGCAASALAFAGLMSFVIGLPPTHGWLLDGLAGCAAGFFYRMFAGAQPAGPRERLAEPRA